MLRCGGTYDPAVGINQNVFQANAGFLQRSSDVQQLNQFDKDLVLTYKLTVPSYAQIREPLTLVRPRVVAGEELK